VCADLTFGLRARIEEWFTRPKAEEIKKSKRKEALKKVLASHHHRRNSFSAVVAGSASSISFSPSTITKKDKSRQNGCQPPSEAALGGPKRITSRRVARKMPKISQTSGWSKRKS